MAFPSRLVRVCMIWSSSTSARPSHRPSSTRTPPAGQPLDLVHGGLDELEGLDGAIRIGRVSEPIRSMSSRSLISRVSRSLLSTATSTIDQARSPRSPTAPPASSPSEPRIDGQRGPQLVADHREELVLHPLHLAPVGDVAEDHHRARGASSLLSSTGLAVTSTGKRAPPGPGVGVLDPADHRTATRSLGHVALAARPFAGGACSPWKSVGVEAEHLVHGSPRASAARGLTNVIRPSRSTP